MSLKASQFFSVKRAVSFPLHLHWPCTPHSCTCAHRFPGLMCMAHQMREMVCWPHFSELHLSERLTENQFYPRNLKGDWKGRAHFSSSQKYKALAQTRGNHCKLNFWPWWRKAKAVCGRDLTVKEVTDLGSNRSCPGKEQEKKNCLRRAMSLPLVLTSVTWRHQLLLYPLVS